MRQAALTFAWSTWRQHRVELLGAVALFIMGTLASAILAQVRSPAIKEWIVPLEFLVVTFAILLCFVSIFTYGDYHADVLSRASCFPPSLFRLPVRAGSLVAWPMAYGAALPAALWFGIVWFITSLTPDPAEFRWPLEPGANMFIPLWWPATLAAAAMAWLQAILWSPLGLRGLRVVLVSVVGAGLIALAIAMELKGLSEANRVVLFGGLIGFAWAVGYFGVCQARRGVVPDWEWIYAPIFRLFRWWPQSRLRFTSAVRAHEWLQFRIWGRSLLLITGAMVPMVFWPLFLDMDLIGVQMMGALMVPVVLAGFTGGFPGGGKSQWAKDRSGLSTLLATMPIDNSSLVRIAFKVAAISALKACALTWAVVALMLLFSVLWWHDSFAPRVWQHLLENNIAGKFALANVAAAITLYVWTWKRTINSYFLGLLGRVWLVAEIVLWVGGYAAFAIIAGAYLNLSLNAALPPLFAVLILCRILLALWALRVALWQDLLKPQTIVIGLALWVWLALILIWLLTRAIPNDAIRATHIAIAVLFAFPMVRLAAAPLILAKVRHR